MIGYDREELSRWFGSVREAGRIDNGVDLDNDEQGTLLWVVSDRRAPWSRIWPQVRFTG